jgi:hypothetical protein
MMKKSILYFPVFGEPNQGNYTCQKRSRTKTGIHNVITESETATVLIEQAPSTCWCSTSFPELPFYSARVMCSIDAHRSKAWPLWQLNYRRLEMKQTFNISNKFRTGREYDYVIQKPYHGRMRIRHFKAYDQATDAEDDLVEYRYLPPTLEQSEHGRRQANRLNSYKTILLPKVLFPNEKRYSMDSELTIKISRLKDSRVDLIFPHCGYFYKIGAIGIGKTPCHRSNDSSNQNLLEEFDDEQYRLYEEYAKWRKTRYNITSTTDLNEDYTKWRINLYKARINRLSIENKSTKTKMITHSWFAGVLLLLKLCFF